jgi:Kef-type K+ transport system membrane component KefB
VRTLIVVSLIFALAYLFTLPVFSTRWSFLGFRALFLSGIEFLLVGFLAGPRGLNLIPSWMLDSLDPVVHLALGWAGFVFGLQFNRKMLRVYPAARYVLSFSQALVTMAVVAVGGWLVFRALWPTSDPPVALHAAVVMAICAGATSPSSIHYFTRIFAVRGRVNRLLKFIAGVDGIPSVLMLGVFTALFHVGVDGVGWALPGWKWWIIATALGVLLGLLMMALVELEFSREELLLFVIGMLVLTGGLARYLHLSSVYVSFVMGATVANTAWHREEVHKVAAYAEKPIYLTFLVLAGSLLVLDEPRVTALAVVLIVLRLVGKLVGNLPWRWASFEPRARSPLLGLALVSQGGLAVVLATDLHFLYRVDPTRAEVTQLAFSAVLISVLVSEVLSPLFIRTLAPKAQRRAEAAT